MFLQLHKIISQVGKKLFPLMENKKAETNEMKYLIVGLGNIGPEYHETRHNIGFMVVDAVAKKAGITFKDGRYGFTTTLSVKGRQLVLLKPSTEDLQNLQ